MMDTVSRRSFLRLTGVTALSIMGAGGFDAIPFPSEDETDRLDADAGLKDQRFEFDRDASA